MIKTIEITVKTFDELTEEEQTIILDQNRNILIEGNDWAKSIIGNWTEKLTDDYGLDVLSIDWELGYPYDSVKLAFDQESPAVFLTQLQKEHGLTISDAVIEQVSNWVINFYYSVSVDSLYRSTINYYVELEDDDLTDFQKVVTQVLIDELYTCKSSIYDWYNTICEQILKELRDTYYDLQSDKSIADFLTSNDYWFDKDLKLTYDPT